MVKSMALACELRDRAVLVTKLSVEKIGHANLPKATSFCVDLQKALMEKLDSTGTMPRVYATKIKSLHDYTQCDGKGSLKEVSEAAQAAAGLREAIPMVKPWATAADDAKLQEATSTLQALETACAAELKPKGGGPAQKSKAAPSAAKSSARLAAAVLTALSVALAARA